MTVQGDLRPGPPGKDVGDAADPVDRDLGVAGSDKDVHGTARSGTRDARHAVGGAGQARDRSRPAPVRPFYSMRRPRAVGCGGVAAASSAQRWAVGAGLMPESNRARWVSRASL